jgi:hypothetical protein
VNAASRCSLSELTCMLDGAVIDLKPEDAEGAAIAVATAAAASLSTD